ncbi:MAG: hypothetical protein ACI9QD_001046 [Thermoproteota archaeon]|jgi:hypothetical protein
MDIDSSLKFLIVEDSSTTQTIFTSLKDKKNIAS